MIPAVALTLWVMFLMMKMSKRMKRNHPEDGKCELYQVVFKQKSIRVIHTTILRSQLIKTLSIRALAKATVTACASITWLRSWTVSPRCQGKGASRRRGLASSRVTTWFQLDLTFLFHVLLVLLCEIQLLLDTSKGRQMCAICNYHSSSLSSWFVHGVSCENYLDGILITSC